MSIPVHCKSCGYRAISQSISIKNSTNTRISGGAETCPQCGGRAEFQSGTYDHDGDGKITSFVSDVIAAFRTPGLSGADLERFQAVTKNLKDGKVGQSEAEEEVEKIGPQFARILKTANENGITFDRILAIILAIQVFWNQFSSDVDVQAALEGIGQQIELSQQQIDVAEKQLDATEKQTESAQELIKELRKLSAGAQAQETKKATQQPAPIRTQSSGKPNRQERRKAEAIARREKKK